MFNQHAFRLLDLPYDILCTLPEYLHSFKDLASVQQINKQLYSVCGNPTPPQITSIALRSETPECFTAIRAHRLVAWAGKSEDHIEKLRAAIRRGPKGLLELTVHVSGPITLDDVKHVFHVEKTILKPFFDLSSRWWMILTEGSVHTLSIYWLYCEMFRTYIPLQDKPRPAENSVAAEERHENYFVAAVQPLLESWVEHCVTNLQLYYFVETIAWIQMYTTRFALTRPLLLGAVGNRGSDWLWDVVACQGLQTLRLVLATASPPEPQHEMLFEQLRELLLKLRSMPLPRNPDLINPLYTPYRTRFRSWRPV